MYSLVFSDLLNTAFKKTPLLPAIPQDSEVWNIDQVLLYLKHWKPYQQLSQLELSKKTLMLLLLSTGRRKIDITHLSLGNMKRTAEKFVFALTAPSKNFTRNYHRCQFFEESIFLMNVYVLTLH